VRGLHELAGRDIDGAGGLPDVLQVLIEEMPADTVLRPPLPDRPNMVRTYLIPSLLNEKETKSALPLLAVINPAYG